jgi:hypothetical protein
VTNPNYGPPSSAEVGFDYPNYGSWRLVACQDVDGADCEPGDPQAYAAVYHTGTHQCTYTAPTTPGGRWVCSEPPCRIGGGTP